jgi:HSP20 family protein
MNNVAEQQNQTNQTVRPERQANRGFVAPPANISGTDNEYILEVEMPGVDKSGIEVTVEGNELTIIGRRRTETPAGELYYSEAPQADFRRAFELGPDVDTGKISAQMDQGILKLRLTKSEKSKPRKIQITG